MRSSDYKGGHRGLTMSELVVILAVIIIGSAIVSALAARNRERERNDGAPAQLKRLSSSVRQYVRDSDGYFHGDSHEARITGGNLLKRQTINLTARRLTD